MPASGRKTYTYEASSQNSRRAQSSIQEVAMGARPHRDSLPPEVYHMIIGDLRIEEVSKPSCTSKGQPNLLKPTLYREIKSKQEDANIPFPALLLLRSILSRPHLCVCGSPMYWTATNAQVSRDKRLHVALPTPKWIAYIL